MRAAEQVDREEDDSDIPLHEIEGYDWYLEVGENIGPDTLLPGLGEDVHRLVEKAGYTPDMKGTVYVSVMIETGGYDWIPEFTGNDTKHDVEAMTERVGAHTVDDDAEYWVLKEAPEVEA